MKKLAIILTGILACFILFAGCINQKDHSDQDTNLSNCAEIDDTDLKIDAEDNSDNVTLPKGFTYTFRDPNNSDGIVVTPRE